jgi:anti-sigma factor RsiW
MAVSSLLDKTPFRGPALTCQELVELVTEYLEGSLSRRDARRFEKHIGACPHCSNYLGQLRQTLGLLGSLHEGDVPPAAREELLNAFRDWKAGR